MINQSSILEKCRQLDSKGRIDASINLLTDAIKHSPSASLHFQRGWRREEIGQYDLAKDDYTRAIQIESISRYLMARGLLLSSRLSDHESAMRDYQQALTLDAQNPVLHVHLALCSLLLGRLRDAIEYAKVAVELAPEDPAAHSCLGQCLLAASRPIDAVEELQIATSLDPDSANSWSLLAQALRNTRKLAEARVCIERAIKLARSSGYMITYASLLLEMNEPLPAITILQEVGNMRLTEAERYLVEGYAGIGNRMLETGGHWGQT
jgi:tetratricopeptide (TPR) repeat protein